MCRKAKLKKIFPSEFCPRNSARVRISLAKTFLLVKNVPIGEIRLFYTSEMELHRKWICSSFSRE